MTKLLDQAIEAVRSLPPAAQDEVARTILAFASDSSELEDAEDVDAADLQTLLDRIQEAEDGKLATEEDVEAVFRRFIK